MEDPDTEFSGLLAGAEMAAQQGSQARGYDLFHFPPQVRFSRPESEQARQRRVQSYEFLQKKHAEEPWVHLHYYGLRVSEGEPGFVGPGGKYPGARKGHGMASMSHLELKSDS